MLKYSWLVAVLSQNRLDPTFLRQAQRSSKIWNLDFFLNWPRSINKIKLSRTCQRVPKNYFFLTLSTLWFLWDTLCKISQNNVMHISTYKSNHTIFSYWLNINPSLFESFIEKSLFLCMILLLCHKEVINVSNVILNVIKPPLFDKFSQNSSKKTIRNFWAIYIFSKSKSFNPFIQKTKKVVV